MATKRSATTDPWDTDDDIPKKKQPRPEPRRRITFYPGGNGRDFICDPPDMLEEALLGVLEVNPKLSKAIKNTQMGGLTVIAKDILKIAEKSLSGVSTGKPWRLTYDDDKKRKTPRTIQRVDLLPGGKGKLFICDPPGMAGLAADSVCRIYSKIIYAVTVPRIVGGLRVHVSDRLTVSLDTLSGVSDDKPWRLVIADKSSSALHQEVESDDAGFSCRRAKNPALPQEVESDEAGFSGRRPKNPALPQEVESDEAGFSTRLAENYTLTCGLPPKILLDLQIDPRDPESVAVAVWLYSFSGQTRGQGTDVFLLVTVDDLVRLGFISDCDHPTRQLQHIVEINPENILLYEDCFPRMLSVTTLEDVPGSVIFNPLTFKPHGNALLAIRKGSICKALSNCKTPIARALGDMMADYFEYFMIGVAEKHAADIGDDRFQKEVVGPAEESLSSYVDQRANEFETKFLRSETANEELRTENKRETIGRLTAEVALEDEVNKHNKTRREGRLAILDKQTEFDNHLAVNKPAQTMTHEGDDQPRVGCMLLKPTDGSDAEKSELLAKGYTTGDATGWDKGGTGKTLADINSGAALMLASHYSEMSSSNASKMTIHDCYKTASGREGTGLWESIAEFLTLLGGFNVINYRSIFREEMVTFGGSKRNSSVFAVPPGGLAAVVDALKERCYDGFAVGVYDGRLLFFNQLIFDSLPEGDQNSCSDIVRKLTGRGLRE
jgi:hypothetical protein